MCLFDDRRRAQDSSSCLEMPVRAVDRTVTAARQLAAFAHSVYTRAPSPRFPPAYHTNKQTHTRARARVLFCLP